jgi:hypothetical protein
VTTDLLRRPTPQPKGRGAALALMGLAFSALATGGGCNISSVDPSTLPEDLREPYALFEVRCSKCHTIARPLNAPVRDATHWELYITRMRRQPGSGINREDAREIMRFLVYYTTVIRGHGSSPAASESGTSGAESPPSTPAAAGAAGADEGGIIFEEEGSDADGE